MAHSYGLYFIIFIKHGDGTFTIYNHFNLMFPTTNIHGRRSLMGGMFDDTNGRNAHLGVSESGISTSTPFHPLDNHHVFLYMIIHVAENWQNLEVNPTVHPFCRYKTTSQALKSQELPGLAVHRSFRPHRFVSTFSSFDHGAHRSGEKIQQRQGSVSCWALGI